MEKFLPLNDRFESSFREHFPKLIIHHHVEVMKGNINVFFIELSNEETLGLSWEKVRNFIAVYYQNHLESDFERWNIYIIFIVPTTVSNQFKYKIENDQFSSRKIVIDSFQEELSEKVRKVLLSTYIRNELSIPNKDNNGKQHTVYTSNSIVFSIINKTPKNQKERDQYESLYDNIINELKNENSKG